MEIFREARLLHILSDLLHKYFAHQEEDHIQLTVRIATSDLPIRDLSSYLELIDRTYGRLHSQGLASYAQVREKHIRMSQVYSGAMEALIDEWLANIEQASYLLMLYLVLKYLPELQKTFSAPSHPVDKQRSTSERALIISSRMEEDKLICDLNEEDQLLIAETMVSLTARERKNLLRASRFALEHVLNLQLAVA